ncbi:TetR/AcrR family transcriptional regulator [Gordonia crocea]|uniref:HTH tetR-type domain-containing protein n=1 Tax=Gordonia crocea TaxID=589162 RepID=A0A7I9UXX6_9ACTN|nr:TetR family transcriptional regulator [Gordonia crocea]GED97671.1 hypothetical protein nbrc107697_17100 [Gordonia crocea]
MDEQRVIDGALAVIADTGLRNLTLASVATRAGVSRASVYRTFDNRAALIDAVVAHELATMETILSARVRYADDAAATVRAIVREVLAYFDENPALRAILRHDGAELTPFLVEDGSGHPTLVAILNEVVWRHIGQTPVAEALRPDARRAVEHLVRVVFTHFLIPTSACTDDDVARLVADAVVAPA